MDSTYHWGSVNRNTNLLQIHFPKVKPPHLKFFFRLKGLKGWKWFWKKSSLISNFFPWFWLKTPCFSLISLTGKSLQIFPWIPSFSWSVGTLSRSIASVYFSTILRTDEEYQSPWHHTAKPWYYHSFRCHMFFTEASERRHAEANEDEIRVHQTGKHLREIGSNIPTT